MLELTTNDITLGCQEQSKAEVLSRVCQIFQTKGFTSSKCLEQLEAREKQISTYLGNGIALPHISDHQGNIVQHSGVHLFQFPHGIRWDKFHIAFLVIAVAAQEQEHLTILKDIASLLSNELVTRALSSVSNKDDFLKILKG